MMRRLRWLERVLAVGHGVQSAKCVRAFGHRVKREAKRVLAVGHGVQSKTILKSKKTRS